jgi:hypothetical protein
MIKQIVSSLMAPIPREVSEKILLLKNLQRNPDQQRVLTMDEIQRLPHDSP